MTTEKKFYELEYFDNKDAEAAINRDDPEELLYVPISVSMTAPDFQWAQSICIRLSSHRDFNVRGNAILGFGHLARRLYKLNKEIIKPIIEAALRDDDEFVRGQALLAAKDLRKFLKWRIKR
ncbi:MAG: hypothetical protein AB1489_36305 [Acidobacteriota bacterium]